MTTGLAEKSVGGIKASELRFESQNLRLETGSVELLDRKRGLMLEKRAVFLSDGLLAIGHHLRDCSLCTENRTHLCEIDHEQTSQTNQPDVLFYDGSSRVSSRNRKILDALLDSASAMAIYKGLVV
jgi:hypothetical protein